MITKYFRMHDALISYENNYLLIVKNIIQSKLNTFKAGMILNQIESYSTESNKTCGIFAKITYPANNAHRLNDVLNLKFTFSGTNKPEDSRNFFTSEVTSMGAGVAANCVKRSA